MTKVLIVEARFYDDVHDMILSGAKEVFDKNNVEYEVVTVKGALEIPAVVKMAEKSKTHNYDGYLCLGCVIRGETTHYDYVCQESCRGIMDLSLKGIAIANGVITVENKEQAVIRANPEQKNKGGVCANVVLDMIKIKNKFIG